MRKAAVLLALIAATAAAQIVATPPIGGFTLPAGGCFTQPVTYAGAAVGSTIFTVNPQTFPGNGVVWQVYVSATNQVTVKVCGTIAGFVNAAVYDVQQSTSGTGFITGVSATAPITSSGGTTPNISATYQGNGAKVQASTGTITGNDCVKFDANGNTIDAGAPCATGTVTGVSATAPLTSSGGATPTISAAYQGNGAKVQASTGTTTTNDCVKFDANGNTIDAGAACGTVTGVSATGPLISSGGATPTISAAYQGNGAKVQASTGTTTTNDCVKFDVNGNTVDSGAACATSGGFTPISTPTCSGGAVCTIGTGSAVVTTAGTTVTFPLIPAGFKTLQLTACGRTNAVGVSDNVLMALNGDASTNYNIQDIFAIGTAPVVAGLVNGVTPTAGTFSGSTATASRQGCFTATVAAYTGTTFQKIINSSGSLDAGVSGLQLFQIALNWINSAAVTSIVITPSTGPNFQVGTSFFLNGY